MVRQAESPMAKYTDERDAEEHESSLQPPSTQIFVKNRIPMKIWLSRLTPSRSTYIKMIKDHGGKESLSEIGSEIRIGDHLKQACIGMISYRWIEECIREGQLVEEESHRIHRLGNRHGGTGGGGSGLRSARRNEFSPADDRILIDYLKRKKAAGESLQGNNIYKTFADAYPHHTFQSWRNRWVKVLARRPDVLTKMGFLTSEQGSPPRSTYGFTREQDQIIIEAVKQPGANTEDPKFWERLALTHVAFGISAQQWKERYFERLQPEVEMASSPFVDYGAPHLAKRHALSSGIESSNKRRFLSEEPLRPVETNKPSSPKQVNSPARAPIPTVTLASKTSRQTTEARAPSTATPPPKFDIPIPKPATRSASVPISSRRLSSMNVQPEEKPMSGVGHRRTASAYTPTKSSPLVPKEEIIYQDPIRRTIIRRNPAPRTPNMPADDALVHQQVTDSTGRRSRIRVSLGDITLEIESDSSPRFDMDSPLPPRQLQMEPSGTRSSAGDGAEGRKAIAGEIPSTPGSSPVKYKTEKVRKEQMLEVEEDVDLREPLDELGGFGGDKPVEESAVEWHIDRDQAGDFIPTLGSDDEIMDGELENLPKGFANTAFGAETQALFEQNEDEELEIPNLDIESSPIRGQESIIKLTPRKTTENLADWVAKKARRYNLDIEEVWWALERTTCRKALAVQVLKSLQAGGGLPDIAGVWSEEEDAQVLHEGARVLQGMDAKHGIGASGTRIQFLQVWADTARQIQRSSKII